MTNDQASIEDPPQGRTHPSCGCPPEVTRTQPNWSLSGELTQGTVPKETEEPSITPNPNPHHQGGKPPTWAPWGSHQDPSGGKDVGVRGMDDGWERGGMVGQLGPHVILLESETIHAVIVAKPSLLKPSEDLL